MNERKIALQFLIEERKNKSTQSWIELGKNIANSLEHSIPDKKIRMRLLTLKKIIQEAQTERLEIVTNWLKNNK